MLLTRIKHYSQPSALLSSADTLNELMKRNGRQEEACALEHLAETWLELIPFLVQACLNLPHASAFLHDLFQVATVVKSVFSLMLTVCTSACTPLQFDEVWLF